MHTFSQKFTARVMTYRCPGCGLVVPRRSVEGALPEALFACDCGWYGDARDLHRSTKTVKGPDALRVADPPSVRVH